MILRPQSPLPIYRGFTTVIGSGLCTLNGTRVRKAEVRKADTQHFLGLQPLGIAAKVFQPSW